MKATPDFSHEGYITLFFWMKSLNDTERRFAAAQNAASQGLRLSGG
jgi:hypothetical protein